MNHRHTTTPARRDLCGCGCHTWHDVDGVACADGWCTACDDRAGSNDPDGPLSPEEAAEANR